MTEDRMRVMLADNLRYLRKSRKHKLTQKALGQVLHLPRKTIMHYEAGKISPTAYHVWLLANFYGCTMEELLTKQFEKEKVNNN